MRSPGLDFEANEGFNGFRYEGKVFVPLADEVDANPRRWPPTPEPRVCVSCGEAFTPSSIYDRRCRERSCKEDRRRV